MKVCVMKKATGVKLGCLDHDLALVCTLCLGNVYIHVSFSPVYFGVDPTASSTHSPSV